MRSSGLGFFILIGGQPTLVELLDAGLVPNPSAWTQAAFFIDPANATGAASDENQGNDAAHPVLTWNGGVLSKWGTSSPTLRQNTTFTWLSSQPIGNADPVIFNPVMVASVATMQGQLNAAASAGHPVVNRIHAGVFGGAGVVSKNRATGQLLTADLGFAAPIGSLVKNTQAGKVSFAEVYKNVGGTSFALTQPLTPAVMPLTFAALPTEINTWALGDTFEVYAPFGVYLVEVDPLIADFDLVDGFPTQVQLYQLRAQTSDGGVGDSNVLLGAAVTLVESSFDSLAVRQGPGDDLGFFEANIFFGPGRFDNGVGLFNGLMLGGAIISSAIVGTCGIQVSCLSDTIVDTTALSGIGALFQLPSGITQFGQLYIAGEIACENAGIATGVLWGPGTLDVIGSGRLFYASAAGAAVATFLNAGGLKLNGKTVANAFDPATGTWSASLALTPAQLDLAFGGGGFGGLATNVGGASISNQPG